MKRKITVAIDAKELAKKNIGSLGMILLELIPRLLPRFNLLLLSDVEIPSYYLHSGIQTAIRQIPYCGGFDLVKYQYWMKTECEKYKVDWFYQINHFALFRMKGIKQVVVIHDMYPLEEIEHKTLLNRATYWTSIFLTLINSDIIFTVSKFKKERLSHFFWKSKKVRVNYNGIAPIQKVKFEKNVYGKYFLMLGRVSYWKGTFQVAEFFMNYFKNSDYKLVIAGQAQNGIDACEMKKITDKCKNIIWLDYVDDLKRDWLLENADLFLYASRYDGFGKPPLEAALVKTPVLINDIPVLREVTKNKGRYIDFYGNQKEIYNTIIDMMSNKNTKQLEELQKIAQDYEWDKHISETIDVIDSYRR